MFAFSIIEVPKVIEFAELCNKNECYPDFKPFSLSAFKPVSLFFYQFFSSGRFCACCAFWTLSWVSFSFWLSDSR